MESLGMRFIQYAHALVRSFILPGLMLSLVWVMILGAIAGQTFAQPSFDWSTASLPEGEDRPPIAASIESSTPQVQPGGKLVLAVILDHAEHYHSNLNEPIVPEEMGDFLPVPTTIELPEVQGVTFGAIHWPTPIAVDVDFFFTGNPISYLVYAGKTIIYIPVTIAEDASLGKRTFELSVTYQVCDETTCLAPETVPLTMTVNIVESASAAQALTGTFAGYNPDQAPQPREPVAIERRFLGVLVVPSTDSLAGVFVLALASAVGGFILNLTPCVLPVIPIKVMTISQHAGARKSRAFILSVWMAIGVIAFWAGIGIPVAFVSQFTDPSIIFGIWWLTGVIGVVIAVMSFGIMGLFQIKLPQQVYMINPKADSISGSFIFGMMTAVLGLPCFGFVAGALLAGAAMMPAYLVLIVFVFIGIGMALPYVVLAMFPKLIDKLPRTGPASELVKQVMGLLMLAAAAYFLGTSVISFGSGRAWVFPWWSKAVHWWVIGLIGLVTGLWLMIQTIRITKRLGPRLTYCFLGILVALSGSFIAYNQTMHQYHYFWKPFSPEFLATSLEKGKVVVLDFTAEWCLNCKALEATILAREPVKSMLLSSDVVPMVADLTSTNAPGWDHLNNALGQTGIPFLVVYAPGHDDPVWMSNAYNSAQVVEAINLARDLVAREGTAVGGAD